MVDIQLAVLDFIQNYFRTPLGDVVMPMITRLGNAGIFWIATGIVLLISRKYRRTGVVVLAALVIDFLLCNVWLKNAVAATRPFDLNPSVQLLISRPRDYSFPSGHTAASFAAVTALYLGKMRYWYLFLVVAILIAFSRMYLYVHFPVDILGGALVGAASGFLAFAFVRNLSGRYEKHRRSGV